MPWAKPSTFSAWLTTGLATSVAAGLLVAQVGCRVAPALQLKTL